MGEINPKLFDNLSECGIQIWHPNKVIYKYADLATAKLILSNGTLKFSPYSTFNDPFELTPYLIDYTFSKQDIKRILRKDDLVSDRAERKRVVQKATPDPETLKKYYVDLVQEECSRYGISCFSKNPLNKLMWSHYAAKHTGVCLGFKIHPLEFLFILTVNYNPQIRRFNFFKNRHESMLYPIFTKFPEWSYEEEVRAVNMKEPGFGQFDKTNLFEIYYGFKTPPIAIKEIEQLLRAKNYDVQNKMKVDLDYTNWGLKKTAFSG